MIFLQIIDQPLGPGSSCEQVYEGSYEYIPHFDPDLTNQTCLLQVVGAWFCLLISSASWSGLPCQMDGAFFPEKV